MFLQVENLHRNKQPSNICKYNCPREKNNREQEDAIQIMTITVELVLSVCVP